MKQLILACLLLLTGCAGQATPPPSSPLADVPDARRLIAPTRSHGPVPVWYLRPAGLPADAPIVFVMHGVQRDADRYLREWAALSRRQGLVVVVPEFSKDRFPGADSYNLGDTQTADGDLKPRSQWSYQVIEEAFDAVRSQEGLTADSYILYGHSAGAQFVHRFVMLGEGPRLSRAIAANAGWYAFPDTTIDWPYGLKNAPGGGAAETALKTPLTILLGDADTDPDHSSLRRTPEADRQGPHRFARGLAFYEAALKTARSLETKTGWSCAIAPGLGHDNGVAATFAAALIASDANNPAPGAPCRVISPLR